MRHHSIIVYSFLILLSLSLQLTCIGQVLPQSNVVQDTLKKTPTSIILYGEASFYASKFEGRKTASGQIFKHNQFTAACNSLPLGSTIKVTNLRNGKTITVVINDRLHPKTTRLIDLTKKAATALNFVNAGLTRVKIEVFDTYK